MINLYANADWYRERPEPERQWHGVLRDRHMPVGPGSRGGLSYALVTADRELPIYAANVESRLASLIEQQISVVGKLVDLSGDGFGQELWIGLIAPVPPRQY